MQLSPLPTSVTRIALAAASIAVLGLTSCSAPRYNLDDQELTRFMAAGPITPEFDEEQLLAGIAAPTQYAVVPGDLILLRAPSTMFETGIAAAGTVTRMETLEHYARVSETGTIEVPLAGTLDVTDKSLRQIEVAIADAVFPKYLKARPSIVAQIEEYRTVPVTLYGAVELPGIYRLPSDSLTVSGALAAAGGIVKTGSLVVGARKITIYSPTGTQGPRTVALPIRGLNVPYYDLPLKGGERIEVERYEPDRFTVIGLVTSPGAHGYPPETEFNLMQALAIAGGVDRIADPPYATIFRKDLDTGEIIPATFKIKGNGLVTASSMPIKPGDVISVAHTKGSWTRAFMAEVFRLNLGFFVDSRNLN